MKIRLEGDAGNSWASRRRHLVAGFAWESLVVYIATTLGAPPLWATCGVGVGVGVDFQLADISTLKCTKIGRQKRPRRRYRRRDKRRRRRGAYLKIRRRDASTSRVECAPADSARAKQTTWFFFNIYYYHLLFFLLFLLSSSKGMRWIPR